MFIGSKYPGGGFKSSGHTAWKSQSQSGLYYLWASCGETGGRAHPAEMQRKGCCENKHGSMKPGSTCHVLGQYWGASESEHTAAYMTRRRHEATYSFPKQKLAPLLHTYTHKILMSKLQNSQEIVACGAFRLYPWDAIMILHLLTSQDDISVLLIIIQEHGRAQQDQTHCTTQMKTYLDILSIRKTVCAVLLLQVKAWISTVKDEMLQWEGHVMLSYLAITSWFFFWLVNYL